MSIGAPSPVNELRVRSCTAQAPSEAEGVTVCVRVVSARAFEARCAARPPGFIASVSGHCAIWCVRLAGGGCGSSEKCNSVVSCGSLVRNCVMNRHYGRVTCARRGINCELGPRCDGRQAEAMEHRQVGQHARATKYCETIPYFELPEAVRITL